MPRDKNTERVATKELVEDKKNRRDEALSEGLKLFEYTEEVKKKIAHNKNYVTWSIQTDSNFKKPLGVQSIISSINKKYGAEGDKRPVSRTTLS